MGTPSDDIVARARAFGATAAGIAAASDLLRARSYQRRPDVGLPPDAGAVLVLTLAHPATEPQLDHWSRAPGGTEGNRQLQRISRQLVRWLRGELAIRARALPYHVERGGVFLKDAAVLAGLGALGANNLLVTPTLGPRVRLRSLVLEVRLASTGPSPFDPCTGCPAPCLPACPQLALTRGGYDGARCGVQMRADEVAAAAPRGDPVVRYCRACELACPVGRDA